MHFLQTTFATEQGLSCKASLYVSYWEQEHRVQYLIFQDNVFTQEEIV